MTQPGRRRITISHAALPTLPPPLAQLLLTASDPAATSRDLGEAVARAPEELAERVVRAVGALRQDAARLRSVDEALQAVGTRAARGVVSALALAPLFGPAVGRLVDPGRVAAHGLATALWVGEVARAAGQEARAHAITAALLHDVGVVLLDRHAPDDYRVVLETAEREGRHHAEVEVELIGTTHGRVGAHLCAKWMLPPEVVDLVRRHHDEHDAPDDHVLAVADHLAGAHGAGSFAWAPPRPLTARACPALGLGPDALAGLAAAAPRVQAQVAALRALA